MKHQIIFIGFLVCTAFSCRFFKVKTEAIPLARVNESYLYLSDINHLVPNGTSKEDSTLVVQNHINSWAKQQLFIDGAIINLSNSKQQAFDKLVKQYKNDLYTKAYIEALVTRHLDTVVHTEAIQAYYDNNKSIFKLNENLLKFRYIHLDEHILNYNDVYKRFKRFNFEDKKVLDSIAIQFKSYSLNDSIWIKLSQVIDKISVVTPKNKKQLLKKSNFIQLKDSLGVYLMQINEVLVPNDIAPLKYVQPTISQIVINTRKLELIRELEKDIINDAIKNKQFEIYK